MVITERDSKKIILKLIGEKSEDKTKKNIYPHLRKHITANSILITDQWNLYDEIGLEFDEHLTVNHEIGYVINGIHINNAENIFLHVNRLLSTYFHLSIQHFQSYMNEFSLRRNSINIRQQEAFFDSFMEETIGNRLEYNDLITRSKQIEMDVEAA